MINVYFYKFLKRNNSTALPDGTTPEKLVPCLLREGTSLVNPILIIDDSEVQTDSLTDYNYVFIQSFHRYYYINNYVYNNNTWFFYLNCDVLGSFYLPYLANTTQHIIRTSDSTDGNPDLIDNFYKSKIGRIGSSLTNSSDLVYTKSNYSGVVYQTAWMDYFTFSTSGCYIVGIVNADGRGLTYYRMNEDSFKEFINKVLSISISMSTGSGSLNANLSRAIYDPIQFIKYCKWFPINAYIPGNGTQSFKVGSQAVTLTGSNFAWIVTPEKGVMINGTLITIPKSPYAGSLRTYLSLKPFAEYNLYFPIVGMIPLDSARMYKYSKLELKWIIDYSTGLTDFFVIPTNRTTLAADNDPDTYIPSDNSDAMFYSSIAMGVDVPLFNMNLDVKTGLALSGISWIKNKIESGTTQEKIGSALGDMFTIREGSIADKIISGVKETIEQASPILAKEGDAVLDGLQASLGQLQAQGSPASYMTYSDTSYPFISAMFYTQETMQLQKYGMPSDFTAPLRLVGNNFIMCKNPEFNTPSASGSPSPVITKEEQNACLDFLRKGIYIENNVST